METVGFIQPDTEEEAREIYAELRPVAKELVREVAIAMDADREAYEERVTSTVIQTAHEALFGSLLVVRTASFEAFESWLDREPVEEGDVHLEGSEHVGNVAWHHAPATGEIVAATYQNEPEAAVAMLRRITWGRQYEAILTSPEQG